MSAPHKRGLVPANDNDKLHKPLRAVVDIPPDLPIQPVEIEVFAQLLDSWDLTAANDNGPFASWSRDYLTVLTIKIMLAALMIALALANRSRLTPAIHAGESDATEMLRWSVAAELAIGAIVVFLAALLGLLPYSAPA